MSRRSTHTPEVDHDAGYDESPLGALNNGPQTILSGNYADFGKLLERRAQLVKTKRGTGHDVFVAAYGPSGQVDQEQLISRLERAGKAYSGVLDFTPLETSAGFQQFADALEAEDTPTSPGPNLVIRVGLPGSLKRLREDAQWWLRNSDCKIKVVLLFTLQADPKEMMVEQWESSAAPMKSRFNLRNPQLNLSCVNSETVTLSGVRGSSDPFVLASEKVFPSDSESPQPNLVIKKDTLVALLNSL